jgi:hypothetical protein
VINFISGFIAGIVTFFLTLVLSVEMMKHKQKLWMALNPAEEKEAQEQKTIIEPPDNVKARRNSSTQKAIEFEREVSKEDTAKHFLDR